MFVSWWCVLYDCIGFAVYNHNLQVWLMEAMLLLSMNDYRWMHTFSGLLPFEWFFSTVFKLTIFLGIGSTLSSILLDMLYQFLPKRNKLRFYRLRAYASKSRFEIYIIDEGSGTSLLEPKKISNFVRSTCINEF